VNAELCKTFRFEAAHRLPMVPPEHKCSRLHGHGYAIDLVIAGPVDEHSGWVVDFAELREAWLPVFDALDHRYLNEIEGLENPTSENLARWIFERVNARLPLLREVVVHETTSSWARYRP